MARIDREALKAATRNHAEAICREWWSEGKKLGKQWVVGNVNGEPGQSLRIELEGEKAGVAYDFATGEGCDLIELIKRRTGLRFAEIAHEIGRITGENVEEPPTTQYSNTKRQGPRYSTTAGAAAGAALCDWDREYKLSATDIKELVQWRGYTREYVVWAVDKRRVGRNRKFKQWAFPLHDKNGTIVAAHVRNDKNKWFYVPRLTDAGLELSVLIIGGLAGAEKVFLVESQWDGFAIADRLGIQHGEPIAIVCTRGASNAALVSGIQSQINKAEIFVVPQNDDPGKVWTQKIGTTLSTSYKLLSVPEKYHDANDWLKDPGNSKELIGAIQDATSKEPGPSKSRIYIECHRPSYFLAYQPPPDLVLCGDNHIVRGGAFVIGGAPGVGKSRASTALALAGALRAPWFGLETLSEFRTLIIQSENGCLRLQNELAAINRPELEDYLMICPPPPYGLCFNKQEFRDQLRPYQDNHAPHVVIVDPWNAVAFDDRMRDYREAFDIIREVFRIGAETGPALGILAHTRKPIAGERVNGRALLSLLAGSYVLGSIPRCVFVMQAASDDVNDPRIVWTCCKNNDGRLGPQTAWERRNGLFVPVPDFDWEQFRNPEDGRSRHKIKSTVEDLFALIPDDIPILKDDLSAQAYGKVSQNDFRRYLAELLREARIFIHRIKRPGIKSATAYCRKPPSEQSESNSDLDEPDESDLEDDPR